MTKIRNLIGMTFGKWEVLSRVTDQAPIKWLCVCVCGESGIVASVDLWHGRSRSCGCFRIKHLIESQTTHGMTHTKEYGTWEHIIQRCENPNNTNFHHYGGRGIYICHAWRNDFTLFYKELGKAPSRKHSIERIDNEKGYIPGNCRWATQEEQTQNMRTTKKYLYRGKLVSVQQARRMASSEASYITIKTRIRNGWDFTKAIETPVSIKHSINSRSRGGS